MKNNQTLSSLKLLLDSGVNEFLDDVPRKYYANPKESKISSKNQGFKMNNLNNIDNLTDLKNAVYAFEGCELKFKANNTVFADGNPKAKIMLVGEAPGKDEDAKGVPFVGQAGKLLDKMLLAIGLDRNKVYITNIVPWRPPGNRQPSTEEIVMCVPFVQKHIEIIRPELLILLGGTASKALLLSDDGIMRLRGKWHKYSSYGLANPVLTRALFHPAFLLRSPSYKRLAWEDLLIIQKEINSKQ